MFNRYIGIDYSGAETPTSSLKGLRVYIADQASAPVEVLPPPSPRKYWTRKGLAEWLVKVLSEDTPTLVGIDHGFSFPLDYFKRYKLVFDWPAFLDDFHRHWPTDEDDMYVDFIREGAIGDGAARSGERKWRRLCEVRAGAAKSVFFFDVQGSVAKSTHAGLPWLRFLRQQLGDKIHFWPFDGWEPPSGKSVIVEVSPALWKRLYPRDGRYDHQHDAYSVAEWMRQADLEGRLHEYFHPDLTEDECKTASIEGWILGIGVRSKSRLQLAIDIATKAHQDQTDKTGAPYFGHCLRVMEKMATEEEKIVAVMHDVVEDTHWTLDDLRREGYSERVINALDCLTRREAQKESYDDFIKRVQTDSLAIKVKIADLEDNMDLRRLRSIQPEDVERLKKYHRAWLELKDCH
jgi:hypothetical protein